MTCLSRVKSIRLPDKKNRIYERRGNPDDAFDDLTVRDNICIGLDRKAPNIWLKKRIQKSVQEEYYRIFGEDIFDCYINELSDEQKTRVIYMRILLENLKWYLWYNRLNMPVHHTGCRCGSFRHCCWNEEYRL